MEGCPSDRMRFSDRIDINPLAFSILFALLFRDDKALEKRSCSHLGFGPDSEDRQMDGWMDPPFGSAHF